MPLFQFAIQQLSIVKANTQAVLVWAMMDVLTLRSLHAMELTVRRALMTHNAHQEQIRAFLLTAI